MVETDETLHGRAMRNLIQKAKRMCDLRVHCGHERRWLEAAPEDSYGAARYRVTIHVLEGSPPKAYILVTPAFVKAYGSNGEGFYTWKVANEVELLRNRRQRENEAVD